MTVPSLPAISPSADIDEIRGFLQKVQVWAAGREPGNVGLPLDKFVSRQDLVNAGVITFKVTSSPGGGVIGVGGGGSSDAPDFITGLAVTGLLTHFLVEFDAPTYTQGGGNGFTEIYSANYSGSGPLPTFADAVLVGTVTGSGTIFLAAAQPGQESHFWAGAVTVDGIRQVDTGRPSGGINGVSDKTGEDVSTLLDVLTAAALDPASPYDVLALRADLFTIVPTVDFYQTATPTAGAVGDTWYKTSTGQTFTWTGSAWVLMAINPPFFVSTTTITNNGVSAPPGVYITDAFILNGDITNAKIGNLAVDDAKVASMSVAKLIAGSLAVGEYAESTGFVSGSSGWRLDGNGNIEVNNVVARGTIYATAGQIGGANIGTTYVESPGFNGTTHVGWQLNSSGAAQFASLLVVDTTATRIFNTGATGTNPVLQIGSSILIDAAGNASFGGNLSASNIVTTANIQNSAVTNVQASSTGVQTFGAATTEQTIESVVITVTTSGPVTLDAFISYIARSTAVASPPTGTTNIRLYRDSTLIFDTGALGMPVVSSGSNFMCEDYRAISPIFVDTPGAGTYTYTLRGQISYSVAAAATFTSNQSALVATEIKR